MVKAAKKIRTKNFSTDYKNKTVQSFQRLTITKPQAVQQAYDASRYIKTDLKWSAIAGGIVVLLLIISYIFLR
jgi:hypothetical protein